MQNPQRKRIDGANVAHLSKPDLRPLADQRRRQVSRRADRLRVGGVDLWGGRSGLVGWLFSARAKAVIDKTLLVAGWVVMVAVGTQVLPVSRLAIHPEAVTIRGNEVSLLRTFPLDALGLPRPHISYTETVKPLTQTHNGGHRCTQSGGPFQYTYGEQTGRWKIDWASDCTSDPAGFTWSAEWRWHIGGLQMGPTRLSETIIK